ncbi:MAG TPA: GNAT family N-acetyltransferase [Methylocella sp.]|nr:GNAT family N-acetyltransferase [Methylocella sp.]
MNPTGFPEPTLRPYLPSDLPLLSEIRLSAIEELTVDDYDETQRQAWASAADDDDALTETLEKSLTLIALIGGGPVGFIALKDETLIDQLYVHPAVARTGVASNLVDAIEKLAAARGTTAITVDSSDTARPLFEARGYQPVQRNTVEINGVWLGNTRMTKTLMPKPGANG